MTRQEEDKIRDIVFSFDEYEFDENPDAALFNLCVKAYNLGRNSKKCKEDSDNPYHIDYKRQIKLDL